MHAAAYNFVGRFRTDAPVKILDIGGRNLNGSTRDLFATAFYEVIDIRPGEGVHIVANAAEWEPDDVYDMVVCTEVFEHTPEWPLIVKTAQKALRPGGLFVFTCAGPGRPEHSGVEATGLLPGEYYANVYPHEMRDVLETGGWAQHAVQVEGLDLQGWAIK